MQLGTTAEKLQEVGVETVGIIASQAERARLYFRYRPVRHVVGADPDLVTHRAYGVPFTADSPEIQQAVQTAAGQLARELKLDTPASQAYEAIGRLDGFTPSQDDEAEHEQHQAQLTAQFLVDREGTVRWANIECAQEGLAGVSKFPSAEELLTAARALPR